MPPALRDAEGIAKGLGARRRSERRFDRGGLNASLRGRPIRKILCKLGIADEMDANLELYKNAPESVGKIYINKKIQQDFANRMLDNGRRYKKELAVLGLDPEEYAYGEFPKGGIDYEKIPFEPAKTSRKRKSLVEIEPEIDTVKLCQSC